MREPLMNIQTISAEDLESLGIARVILVRING